MKTKAELRRYFKQIRRQMTDKQRLDNEIFKLLINCEPYTSSDVIFTYVSSQGEVDTRKLIAYALTHGKAVAVPKCETQKCTMKFYLISSMDDLIVGAYDILEPDIDKCAPAQQSECSLCIVPGLSFDKCGYRLGFGKGYYDRFLADFKGSALGLCYENCLSDELIINEFDKQVSVLITEKYIYKF
ncbi:MAG: 5-formyltetrahydrofolate cyclo-ligase [Faecalibacterium sp.]|nr:5-formyltetrahydrofolate cyclo-ligase [Ruminococcus sp.]MCM1391682.1 5-formyltetrahydrofolate cyclo-ligase [Ruminococcus sp.]MCM1485225.1 5-formyltetrahydrofolate cyclo-ligase [Faecalibacterium sp.]